MFWGLGLNSAPFQGGTLCVQPPLERFPMTAAGGTPNDPCSGVMSQAITKQFLLNHGLSAGTAIYTQFWTRHPTATSFGTTLSNGVSIQVWP